jgi:glutathione S-transferase
MLLYDSAVSGNCYKVRLLLAQLSLSYERREVDVIDRSNRPELLAGLNPALRVPTLVLDDGRSLAESNAILWYFAKGTSYLPEDSFAQAKVLQWLFFEQYSHEPYIAVLRFWLAIAKLTPAQEELEAKRTGGEAALDALERQLELGPYLVGDAYTIADIALYAYTHVAEEAGFDLTARPATRAWLGRVKAQPRHVPITS